MWQELVDKKEQWIGGLLTDFGDLLPPSFEPMSTKIVDMKVGPDYFEVIGEDFTCGGARDCLGIAGNPRNAHGEGLTFSGYGGHEWSIAKPAKEESHVQH